MQHVTPEAGRAGITTTTQEGERSSARYTQQQEEGGSRIRGERELQLCCWVTLASFLRLEERVAGRDSHEQRRRSTPAAKGGRGTCTPEATGSLIDQSVVPRRDGFTLPTGYRSLVFNSIRIKSSLCLRKQVKPRLDKCS